MGIHHYHVSLLATIRTIVGVIVVALGPAASPVAAGDTDRPDKLPAYSEEREAAALHFVQKHGAELLPLLERLKAGDPKKYQQEIREIFHTSELLTELREEDPKRYDLELDVWKTEAKALMLVARLTAASEEEQAQYKGELQEQTRRLVDLDMQVLKLRVEELQKELGESKEQLARAEEKREAVSKERYEKLFQQAKRRGMMR